LGFGLKGFVKGPLAVGGQRPRWSAPLRGGDHRDLLHGLWLLTGLSEISRSINGLPCEVGEEERRNVGKMHVEKTEPCPLRERGSPRGFTFLRRRPRGNTVQTGPSLIRSPNRQGREDAAWAFRRLITLNKLECFKQAANHRSEYY